MSVVGARPQFIKLKPISDSLASRDLHHLIIHTGQHYDSSLSDDIFTGLGIPTPDVNLAVGSGPQAQQTGEILIRIEPVLQQMDPEWVLVYGDTNSTVAGTLAAVKTGLKTAHVEAGLRSRNRAMPEEINRVVTDHASDLLLAPTELAMTNLGKEGLSDRSFLVGDVMADLLLTSRDQVNPQAVTDSLGLSGDYVVSTVHRASNTDDLDQLKRLVIALARLDLPVVLVAHPRLTTAAKRGGIALAQGAIRVIEPLDHVSMLSLIASSRGLITDSGGLQKEAFLLGIPCTTLRTESEWPETLSGGMNVLAPNGENLQALVDRNVSTPTTHPYGIGRAAEDIVDLLIEQS